jgi:trk system potassium uptake protein TrkA
VGVVRSGEALVPKGDTVLEARDHVFLICEREDVSEVVGAVTTDTSPVRNVMILGGGRIGLLLALSLEEVGISVKVIERDAARARYVASQLRKGLALHDEGVSREFLLQERVDRADAFVAVTGDDRTNLLAAMNARHLGAALTVAGISREEFAPLSEALGVDIAISPRLLAAGAILRFVRRGQVAAVTLLESGAQVKELRVSPWDCRSPAGRSRGGHSGGRDRGRGVEERESFGPPTGRDVLEVRGRTAVVFAVEDAVDEVEEILCTLAWSRARWAP